jgi:transposase, IS5 family
MRQITFAQAASGFEIANKRTRRRIFLEEMEQVVPWAAFVALIEPHAPKAKTGRPPFGIETMLRIHFLQQWFGHSDPAMEEALHDIPLYRDFVRLDAGQSRMPDETTILRFRRLLEEHSLADKLFANVNESLTDKGLMLKTGTIVDATLIAAPTSTKNDSGERDPEMHQTKKGNQWYFGMKAHIGVDAQSGLVHSVVGTAANVHDLTPLPDLLHGEEVHVLGDAGYRGVEKRAEHKGRKVKWYVAMLPGKRRALDEKDPIDKLIKKAEKIQAGVRAKVEHAFRILKQQFKYAKVRYRGLEKNTMQLTTLFMLGNLWQVRKALMKTG